MLIKILFTLFVVVPLLELYVLIEVGSGIGGLTTIILCLLTATIGGLLIRVQGIRTLIAAQQQVAQGSLPAEHGIHGILLAIAGVLLFLPGFITDSIGFLLLIPQLRQWLLSRLITLPHTTNKQVIIEAEIIDKHAKIKH